MPARPAITSRVLLRRHSASLAQAWLRTPEHWSTTASIRRLLLLAVGIAAVVASSAGAGVSTNGHSQAAPVVRLTLRNVATPRLPVPRYDTSGSIPQVTDQRTDLKVVNTALRDAVLRDQRAYTPRARSSAKIAGRSCRGIYNVEVERRLVSASSVVVSALLPARKLYPCGNDGNGWVSLTIRVPSGKPVSLADLFRDARGEGLFRLGVGWFRVITRDWRIQCVVKDLAAYRPTLRNYRYFALTPRGLVLGFWQEPACNRIEGIVPYARLRPYLSQLGKQLVAGVRRPHY